MALQMSDYKPNSHKYKNEQATTSETREIKKVASGSVKKKSEARKVADMFISEDASDIKQLLLTDIIVPGITRLISDGIQYAVDVLFKGKRGASNQSSSFGTTYTNYGSYSTNTTRRYANDPQNKTRFDDDILFKTYSDAEAVLSQMDEVIGRYGIVTVSDMYDMAQLSAPFTANRFGWRNLRSADIRHVRDGWVIKLPPAEAID